MSQIENLEILEQDGEVIDGQVIIDELKNSRATCWVGTWNNPKMTDKEFFDFLTDLHAKDILQYACFQREKGEEGEVEHFQFFVNWKTARYFKWIKETLPYGAHFKRMRTTKTACRNYCMKPDTRISETAFEIGEFIEERKRTDLLECRELLKEGMPFEVVADMYPTQSLMYERQLRGFEQQLIKRKERKNRRVNMVVNYVYGKAGKGKTSYILDKYGDENVYRVSNYKRYPFDFYENEKVIIFEEYHSQFDFDDFLNFMDIYFCPLPARYNHKVAVYENVYLTSNEPVDKLYPDIRNNDPETWNALMRRIHNVYNYDDPKQRQMLRDGIPNPNPFYKQPDDPQICEQTGMRILTPEESADLPF